MNNIDHLISQKLACNEAGVVIITSVNHDFKMMTIPLAPRIQDSQTVMCILLLCERGDVFRVCHCLYIIFCSTDVGGD